MTNVTINDKLNVKTVGIYFGAFAPMHMGHYQQVVRAMSENDLTVVIVDGFKDDKGDKIGLPVQKRYRAIQKMFVDEPSVIVTMIDEGHDSFDSHQWKIPAYPDGWQPWLDAIVSLVEKNIQDYPNIKRWNWYVGEPEYKDELIRRLNNSTQHCIHLADRLDFTISATKIRSNTNKYFDYIIPPFKSYFNFKTLVLGGPSTGKTTLIRRLAKTFNADYSVETARGYEDKLGITDNDLTPNDYRNFILDQWHENRDLIDDSDKRMVIMDTDAIATLAYARLYLSPADVATLMPLFADTIRREKIDEIILTMPTGNFVLDGERNADWANDGEKFADMVMTIIRELRPDLLNKVTVLNNPNGYYVRYLTAVDVLEKASGIKTGHINRRLVESQVEVI